MKKIVLIVLLAFLANISVTKAQDDKFKALMIYNFTRITGWPDDYQEGNFVISVLGETSVYKELNNIAQTKKVGNQAIEVKSIESSDEMGKSHIVYIPASRNGLIEEILGKTQGTGTLVISEKRGLKQAGACINFFAEDGQLKYEVHVNNMRDKGLKPSTSLTHPENAVQIN